ncbi:hypothetical protein ABIE00_005080 [Arthrobacter sp. OAP107]
MLPFANEGAIESGEGRHDGEHEVGHREVLASEDQTSFDELRPHTFAREALDQSAQVVQVAAQMVHAVHHESFPVARETQKLGQWCLSASLPDAS